MQTNSNLTLLNYCVIMTCLGRLNSDFGNKQTVKDVKFLA